MRNRENRGKREGVPGCTYGIQFTTNLRAANSGVTATNLTLSQTYPLWLDTSVNVQARNNLRRYYHVQGE